VRTVSDDERRARLATRHALAPGSRVATAEAAAAAMTCLHATEPASVHLSAVARSGATRADVLRALHEERTLVLQQAMRRTVFAFPRDLLPAVLGSAAARTAAQLATRLAKEVEAAGLADDGVAWVARACAAVHERLRGAPATTRQLRDALPELALRLEVAPGTSYGGRFPIAPRVLSVLAAGGRVLRGAPAAGWKVSRPFWTTAEDWLGREPERLDQRAGYAELVRRWLWTFGPGTEDDLVWWLGGTRTAVRRALADAGAVPVRLAGGSPAWVRDDDTAEVRAAEPWAALLPALDPTTMGWKGRDFYLGDLAPRLFDANGNGGPTAWWDGRIVGGWTQDPGGAVLVVPALALPRAARRALAAEAERLSAWLDGDIVRSTYQSPLVRARAAAARPRGGR
jgi:hypothetical protein